MTQNPTPATASPPRTAIVLVEGAARVVFMTKESTAGEIGSERLNYRTMQRHFVAIIQVAEPAHGWNELVLNRSRS
jgi:hypothetical protein